MSEAIRLSDPGQLPYVAGSAIAAGKVVATGSANFPRAGVIAGDLAAGASGFLYTKGVFQVDAKASEGIAVGDFVGWDLATSKAVKATDASSDLYLGVAIEAQDATNNLVKVDLNAGVDLKYVNWNSLPAADPSVVGRAYRDTNIVTVSA